MFSAVAKAVRLLFMGTVVPVQALTSRRWTYEAWDLLIFLLHDVLIHLSNAHWPVPAP